MKKYTDRPMKPTIPPAVKPLSFLPALLIMALIFAMSAQPADDSSQVSSTLTVSLLNYSNQLLHLTWKSEQILEYALVLEHYVRKAAHFTEYFLLAVSTAFPLYVYRVRISKLVLLTALFCTLFACSDELHQFFVPGRAASWKDVCIDSAGGICGSLCFLLYCRKARHNFTYG